MSGWVNKLMSDMKIGRSIVGTNFVRAIKDGSRRIYPAFYIRYTGK